MVLGLLVIAALVGGSALALMLAKDRTYVGSEPFTPSGAANPDVGVVYYSRSGHSEAVAREIARHFNANIVRIEADFPLDFGGLRKAGAAAKRHELPAITCAALPGAPRTLYLVAPTWWFRPAQPLWSWVEQNDLTGREVVLVTTGNSRFEQAETDAFAARVQARGGKLVKHLFFQRGRIYWQKTRAELLEEVRNSLSRQRRGAG